MTKHKPKREKTKYPFEIHEQIAVVEYLEILKNKGKIILYSALPNNTYTRSWNQRRKGKLEGVRQGVPDILVVTPKTLFFIEMKRVKGGQVSKEQKEWIEAINKAGVPAKVCKGFDEAKKFIDEIIFKET